MNDDQELEVGVEDETEANVDLDLDSDLSDDSLDDLSAFGVEEEL